MQRGATVACVVLALLCLGAALAEQQVSFQGHQVLRFTPTAAQREALGQVIRENNHDLWAEHPDWVDVRVHKANKAALVALGIPYTLMIPDLEQLINEEKFAIAAASNFTSAADFFTAYRTLDEFNAFMDQLVRDFPSLVTKKSIGKSIQGRDIYGITIKSAKNNRSIGVVYNGGQHAREWIGPMTQAWIANQLVTLYGKDPTITQLVDSIEYTIVPVLNPDGYLYTWSTNRMWRKNRRINPNGGCDGVDNNRNWNFQWNKGGSSSNPCAEDYMGPSGFSEPEELAIANYITNQGNVKGYVDWHAYSQLWMSPWGYTSALPKDNTVLVECAKACADAIRATHGMAFRYGPIATTIYPASGSSADWAYGAANVLFSFAVELRDTGRYGFILPPAQIVPSGEESFAAVEAMSIYMLKYYSTQ